MSDLLSVKQNYQACKIKAAFTLCQNHLLASEQMLYVRETPFQHLQSAQMATLLCWAECDVVDVMWLSDNDWQEAEPVCPTCCSCRTEVCNVLYSKLACLPVAS